MMTQLLCNYLHTCSASPSRHNSYSMSHYCHDAPPCAAKVVAGRHRPDWCLVPAGTVATIMGAPPPATTVTLPSHPHLHSHTPAPQDILTAFTGADVTDVSALMSYAGTAAVSLLVYNWCVHLATGAHCAAAACYPGRELGQTARW